MKSFCLKGKFVLVTGGYGHLGEGICRAFLAAEAKVIVGGRDEKKFKSVFSDLLKNKSLAFVDLDISSEDAIKKSFKLFQAKFGHLNVLVNNAISSPHLKSKGVKVQGADVWREGLLGNLETVQNVTETFLPLLKKSKFPSVINISSMYGFVAPDFDIYRGSKAPAPSPSYYGVAKAGVIQLTKYMASLYGPEGIRFNCVSPGPFPKQVVKDNKKFADDLAQRTLLSRLGTPAEVGGPCVFLASEAASYITGHNLIVDGGWSVR